MDCARDRGRKRYRRRAIEVATAVVGARGLVPFLDVGLRQQTVERWAEHGGSLGDRGSSMTGVGDYRSVPTVSPFAETRVVARLRARRVAAYA
jgi:hypothetical protein